VRRARGGRGSSSAAVILIVVGLVLVVVTLGGIAAVVLSSDTEAPSVQRIDGPRAGKTGEAHQGPGGTTPGAKTPLRLGKVKVEVRRADYAVPRGRDEKNLTVDLGEKVLGVYVDVHNNGSTPVEYKSWYLPPYQAGDALVSGQTALVDDQGRVYPAAVFEKVSRLDGHTASESLAPEEGVSDALYFKVPNIDVQYYELVLPAAAVGQQGTFKFRIERDTIQGM
jgi:hypothetical protein